MHFQFLCVLAGLALSSAFPAHDFERDDVAPELKGKRYFVKRDGVDHTVFEHEATGATIDFVTNSGICETTPGVNQYSGYLSVGSRSSFDHPVPTISLILGLIRQREYVVLVF
jgi:hypothetical protein